MTNVSPKVSFIIPTLNSEQTLEKCLLSIKKQNYPKHLIEILIIDGGSTDKTLVIANKYTAKILGNPYVYQEPAKEIGIKRASGKIAFFTDSDNIIVGKNWIKSMVLPYLQEPNTTVFLGQTVPAPDSNSFDRYLGYLSTDPLTFFIYQNASTPRLFGNSYKAISSNPNYSIYRFNISNHILIGQAQGLGVRTPFTKYKKYINDDILSVIKHLDKGSCLAFVPNAKVYHYHVKSINEFIKKYSWRTRNNLIQKHKGSGLINRQQYLNKSRQIRQFVFPIYALSIIFPIYDSIRLYTKYKDPVVFWHPIASLILTCIIIKELFAHIFRKNKTIGNYGT